MKRNNLLSNKQFGFLQGRSTTLQLLTTFEDWINLLNKPEDKNKIDAIYMDFQKAFDKVPHQRLLKKMAAYGIDDHTNVWAWVRSFLTGRTQQVQVNGILSEPAPVTSGIPQGSVLGPSLFVLYINDLPETVENTVYLFADDTKIFGLANNTSDTKSIQSDLNKLHDWSQKWLLLFHPLPFSSIG